jgi:hypothetical protein
MASVENNCQIIVRFSRPDPKRDLRLTAGEVYSFKALEGAVLLQERTRCFQYSQGRMFARDQREGFGNRSFST